MLNETLRAIRTVADISSLFAKLGYAEDDLTAGDEAVTAARWKDFNVVAAQRTCAAQGARELALKIARTNELSLAVVVDECRTLAIAAPRFGLQGITKVLTVSLDKPSGFALEQIERLRPSRGATSLAHALLVSEVLSSEAVGQRFFTVFKLHLERLIAAIDGRRAANDRHLVALLSLSRILFLYFVQTKGWLDCRPDYLAYHLDLALARRKNFHRSVLSPLFFGTLNLPPERRRKKLSLGNIPYLNGGLFEPHPAEQRLQMPSFPNNIWRDVFDQLFEHFRFTVRENDQAEAIAPDMLGRVFERLMNADERHDTGTYYTPEPVVRQLVAATIETALFKYLPHSEVQKLMNGEHLGSAATKNAKRTLQQLKILDPAVGSGAFLLGALQELSRLRFSLEPDLTSEGRLQVQKEILRDNLMGIDLNPVAVHIAELRLWLSVVADDPTTDISRVAPLPNLDGIIRQGNTLLDPLGAARTYGATPKLASSEAAFAVCAARHSLFDARGPERRSSTRALRKSEMSAARQLMQSALASTQHAISDITELARSRDLFGKRLGVSAAQQRHLQSLLSLRRELKRAQQRLFDGVLPFFSFEVHAPDILLKGGFDAVVGNPPWVRAEHVSQRLRDTLTERFDWWRAHGGRGFAHQPDLSVAFLERCLELTKEGGALGLLLPSKITSAGYGELARHGLVKETSIEYVHRVSERDASSFGATAYPLALVARRSLPLPDHEIRIGFESKASIPQRSLNIPGPWVLQSSQVRRALDEFQASGIALGENSPPMLGVKTGADRLFVGRIVSESNGLAVVESRDRQFELERQILRPVLRGRDVREFYVAPRGVILWCHDKLGAPLPSLPPRAAHYFEQFSNETRSRSDDRGGPPWELFRTRCVSENHRVVWPDIAQRPRAVVLEESKVASAVPLNTCYVAAAPDRETALAIAAVLNSTWAAAFVTANADEARGGYRRINARVASLLPIPKCSSKRDELVQLSRCAHDKREYDTASLDAAVASALGISQCTQDTLRELANNKG